MLRKWIFNCDVMSQFSLQLPLQSLLLQEGGGQKNCMFQINSWLKKDLHVKVFKTIKRCNLKS